MEQPVKKYRILAFDPGIGNTGWSLLEGNTGSTVLTILKMGEFHPGPTADKAAYRDQVEKYDKRVISLTLLREEITKLLLEYKPNFVCSEDIYISMFRPQAYGSLAMWICMAKMTVHDVAGLRFTTITTKQAKKCMSSRGDCGKIGVQDAVKACEKVKFKDVDDMQHMTEHEADSIAVGVAYNELNRDYILACMKGNV